MIAAKFFSNHFQAWTYRPDGSRFDYTCGTTSGIVRDVVMFGPKCGKVVIHTLDIWGDQG